MVFTVPGFLLYMRKKKLAIYEILTDRNFQRIQVILIRATC
jgi:hypothetical protein